MDNIILADKSGLFNAEDVGRAFDLFAKPDSCVELRIPKAGRAGTISGYFTDREPFVQAVQQYNSRVPGIYATLNPVRADLMARAANRVRERADNTTSDVDILRRRWLLIDLDAARVTGISSTDEEHQAALDRARAIWDWLAERGWPAPVLASSGNGGHLLYRIDLPNDKSSKDLVKRNLEALALVHNDDVVTVDVSVFNASRITKVYGTVTAKGDNVPDRPHRCSRLLNMPDNLQVVPAELLQQLARMGPDEPQQERGAYVGDKLDVEKWLNEHGQAVRRRKFWNGGTVYELEQCPFNPDHGPGDSSVIQFASGAVAFRCFHNSCADKDWHDLRDKLEPGWRDRQRERRENSGTTTAMPLLVTLADVQPETVNWLWFPYIPRGKLTLLDGNPGEGKTWIMLALAASVSQGWPLPGESGKPDLVVRTPAPVLYLTAEDGLGDTLRPRLDKVKADVTRITALAGTPDGQGKSILPVTLTDHGLVRTALEKVKPALVVVDPIQAYLGADVDMHRANQVRPVLAKLARLAAEFSCAVVMVRHLGKGQQDQAIYRGLGSIDFAGTARSVLLAGKSQKDKTQRAVVQIKNNLEAFGAAIGYTIEDGEFRWTGKSDLTAADLLAPERSAQEKTRGGEAEDFLRETLANGPKTHDQVLAYASALGISERTLDRAKKKLGVISQKLGNGGPWSWKLPEGCQNSEVDANRIRAHDGTLQKKTLSLTVARTSRTAEKDAMAPFKKGPEALQPQHVQKGATQIPLWGTPGEEPLAAFQPGSGVPREKEDMEHDNPPQGATVKTEDAPVVEPEPDDGFAAFSRAVDEVAARVDDADLYQGEL